RSAPDLPASASGSRVPSQGSVVKTPLAAHRLDLAADLLAFEPALLRGEGRPRGATRLRPHAGLAKQLHQPLDRIGSIALLGAETTNQRPSIREIVVPANVRTTGALILRRLGNAADGDGEERLAPQLLRDASGVVWRHRVDDAGAPVDIVDRHAVELILQERA